MRNTSAPAVPVATTLRAVPALTSSCLLNRLLTVPLAVAPSRAKLALPAASTLTVIAPVADPTKLTAPANSL